MRVRLPTAMFRLTLDGVKPVRGRNSAKRVLFVSAIAAAVAACWIVPARLAYEGTRYTFAYIGDEYIYAQRIQPIAGATNTNPVNGVCDPNAISPYFLEDACRTFLRLTGLDAIAFVWSWRVVMPLALMLSMLVLARACLPRTRPPGGADLRLAGAAAGFALLFFVYDLVIGYPPCHGYLDRFPSNIEYPLAVLYAALCLRFAAAPNSARGVAVALGGAALIYLRPYAALSWGLATALLVLCLLATRRLSWRALALTVAVLVVCLLPWLYVSWNNSNSAAYSDLLHRYFQLPGPGLKRPYEIHPQWKTYLALAGVLALLLPFCRLKEFVFSCALTLAALPFISGLFTISSELIGYDRYGVFYLIALVAAGMLAIGNQSLAWRGKRGAALFARGVVAALVLAVAGTGALAYKNFKLDFATYPGGTYSSIVADHAYLRAYDWVRQNTPAEALFLVDDGFDWSRAPLDVPGWQKLMTAFCSQEDLFQLVARRRVVHSGRSFCFNVLSNGELDELALLQRATLGLPEPQGSYGAALKKYRPEFIFWRRLPPYAVTDRIPQVPRGYGKLLEPGRTIVYSDDVCEIWRMDYR